MTSDISYRDIAKGQVRQACLQIWPCPIIKDLTETDVRLNLEATVAGIRRSVTLITEADGQTPGLRAEGVSRVHAWSGLPDLLTKWRESRGSSDIASGYASVSVSGSKEWGWIVGSTIAAMDVVQIGTLHLPAGVRLKFSNGKELFSVAGPSGNSVLAELPQNWFGRDEVTFVSALHPD